MKRRLLAFFRIFSITFAVVALGFATYVGVSSSNKNENLTEENEPVEDDGFLDIGEGSSELEGDQAEEDEEVQYDTSASLSALPSTVTTISDPIEIQMAFHESSSGDNLKLPSNMTWDYNGNIDMCDLIHDVDSSFKGFRYQLDLNGYTLTINSAVGCNFNVGTAHLTIKNGKLVTKNVVFNVGDAHALYGSGQAVYNYSLSGLTLQNVEWTDNGTHSWPIITTRQSWSAVNITSCKIESTSANATLISLGGSYFNSSGAQSAAGLYINNSTITGKRYGSGIDNNASLIHVKNSHDVTVWSSTITNTATPSTTVDTSAWVIAYDNGGSLICNEGGVVGRTDSSFEAVRFGGELNVSMNSCEDSGYSAIYGIRSKISSGAKLTASIGDYSKLFVDYNMYYDGKTTHEFTLSKDAANSFLVIETRTYASYKLTVNAGTVIIGSAGPYDLELNMTGGSLHTVKPSICTYQIGNGSTIPNSAYMNMRVIPKNTFNITGGNFYGSMDFTTALTADGFNYSENTSRLTINLRGGNYYFRDGNTSDKDTQTLISVIGDLDLIVSTSTWYNDSICAAEDSMFELRYARGYYPSLTIESGDFYQRSGGSSLIAVTYFNKEYDIAANADLSNVKIDITGGEFYTHDSLFNKVYSDENVNVSGATFNPIESSSSVYIYNTDEGTLTFDSCTFNTRVYINDNWNSSMGNKVYFKDCTVYYIITSGNVYITGSKFNCDYIYSHDDSTTRAIYFDGDTQLTIEEAPIMENVSVVVSPTCEVLLEDTFGFNFTGGANEITGHIEGTPMCDYVIYTSGTANTTLTMNSGTNIYSCYYGIYVNAKIYLKGSVQINSNDGDFVTTGSSPVIDASAYTGTDTFNVAMDSYITYLGKTKVVTGTSSNIKKFSVWTSGFEFEYSGADAYIIMQGPSLGMTGNISTTYDKTAKTLTCTPSHIIPGTIDYTYQWYKKDGTKLGTTNSISYTNAQAQTYYYCVVTASFSGFTATTRSPERYITINKRAVTLTWANTTFTYDGKSHAPTVTVGNIVSGDTVTVTVGNAQTSAGTYTATTTMTAGTTNYTLPATSTQSYTINKADLSITAKAHSITYGASPANNGVTYSGFVNGETSSVLTGSLKYTYNYSQYGAAGDYVITISGLSSPNYTITFATGKLTVNKKTIGISWTNTSMVYNGYTQTPTATATGLVNSDKCTITVTGGVKDVSSGNTATASTLSNSNYALPSAKTTTFAITKAPLTVTCTPAAGTVTYTGSQAKYTASYTKTATTASGLKGSDTVSVVTFSGTPVYKFSSASYTSSTTAPTNAGTYTISLSGLSGTATNYTVTITYATNNLVINKASITPTITLEGFTYAGTLPTPVVSGNLGNATYKIYYYKSTANASTKVEWSSTTTSKSFSVATYNIYVVVNESANYLGKTSANSTFTVKAADFTVSLTMAGYKYADSVSVPTTSGNLSGGTETFYYSTSNSKATGTWSVWSNIGSKTLNAGTYYMYVKVAEAMPYNASESEVVQFKVAKATVNPVLTMNGYTYKGTVSVPTVVGQLENPGITYYYKTSSTGTATEWVVKDMTSTSLNAGTYYMYAVVDATTNYNTATTESVSFTISKASGSITLSKSTGTIKFPASDTLSVTSYVGDGALSVSTTSNIATAVINGQNITITPTAVGTAIFTVKCAEGANYYASTATYSLTVNPGTIAASAYSVTYYNSQYDGQYHSINVTCSISGAKITYSDSETGTYSSNISDYSYKNVTNGNVQVYFKISLPNYADVIASSTVTITPRKLTVTVTPQDYETTFTGSKVPYKGTYDYQCDRLIDGDVINFNSANVSYTYSGSKEAPINVNTYDIAMSGLVATNSNYEITIKYNTGSMKINKFKVSIPTSLDRTLTYDGEEHEYIPNNFNSTYCTIANNIYKNATLYSAVVSLVDTNNTEWMDSTTGSRTFDFTVFKKDIEITVTVNSNSHEYNGSVNYVKGYTITNDTELGAGDDINSIFTATGTLVYKANGGAFVSDAGTYEVSLEGLTLTSANYNISKRTNVKGTYTINKAQLYGVKYSGDLTKVYDGTALSVEVTVNSINDLAVTYDYLEAPSLTNAGSKTIVCIASALNHEDLRIEYTITVNKKEVTIIVNPAGQESVYTGELTYSNANKYYVESIDSLTDTDQALIENNDYSSIITLSGTPTFTFAGSTVMPQNVGSYEIKMSGLSALADNYKVTTINYGSAFLLISEGTMTVTPQNYVGTYDAEEHTGSVNVITLGNQEALIYYSTVSQTAANSKTNDVNPAFKDCKVVDGNVVAYTVYYLVCAPNHYDVEGSFTVLINQSVLTITVNPSDYTTTYSNAVTYPGNYTISSINGLLTGDTESVVTFTGTPLFKFGDEQNGYTTTINQNAGTYKITMENVVASANNYKISTTFGKGTLVIEKKNIESALATLGVTSVIYNGNEQKLVPNVSINLVEAQENVLLTELTDYELSYSNAIDVGEVVITIKGLGNYTGYATVSYHIIAADATDLAPVLTSIDVKIITVENGAARLTYFSDMDLSGVTNEYGRWVVDSTIHTLNSPIYTVSGKKSYEVSMVFEAVNANYSGTTGMLTVNLVKNSVVFDNFAKVITTYSMNEISTPSLGIMYYDETYNGTPAVQYYKDGSAIDYVPTNAGDYQYKVICGETMYYSYAESEFVDITIQAKNINDGLDISCDVADQTYTGSQITPAVIVKFGEHELTSSEISVVYTNNIDATNKSGSKASIYITGLGNYTGINDSYTFTILPKTIVEEMVNELGAYEYVDTGVMPTIVITDSERGKTLLNDLSGDYQVQYADNTAVGTNAKAIITGINNYTGTIELTFEIIRGTISAAKVPSVGVLTSTVDSLLASLNTQLEAYNNEHGSWVFWDNTNDKAYDSQAVVASSVGTGTTAFGIKFIPNDTNYNEVTGRTISIIVSLNDSSVEFNNANIEFTYSSYQVEFTNDFITKRNASGDVYESEFDTDRVTFNFFTLEGAPIITPTNVGTYKVEVVVSSNRKYREARAEATFTINPRNISEATFEYLDADNGVADYQYRAIDIKPILQATYGADVLNSKYTDYTVMGYNNIRDVSANGVTGTIIISGSGNYSGTTTIAFNIVQRDLATLTVADISEQLFSGAEIKPDVTIFNNGVLLTSNDISLEYVNNTNVGIATINITAKENGNYTGSTVVTFVITNKPIDSSLLPEIVNQVAVVGTKLADIELPSNSNGAWAFVLLETYQQATVGDVTQTGNKFELVFNPSDSSYSQVYDSITIIVVRKTANITITSTSLDKVYNTLADTNPSYQYDGDASQVKVTYYQNGTELAECPKDAGNYTVVLTAEQTDMYEAATAQMSFEIKKATIGSANVVVTPVDVQVYEDGKQIVPEITINHTLTNGTYKLVLGTDYSVIAGPNNTMGEGAGTLFVLGTNNYQTEQAYLVVNFDIFEDNDKYDPDGAVVNVTIEAIADQEYTGTAIEPAITVICNGETLSSEYYTVTYSNNTNATTQAVVTAKLTGGYSGEATKTFTILAHTLDPSYVYVSNVTVGETPTVTVKVGTKTLVEDTDYTVQFLSTNSSAGTAQVTVYGKGNYTGEVTKSYTISDEEPGVITINNSFYKFKAYEKVGRLYKWVEKTHTTVGDVAELLLFNVASLQYAKPFLNQFANSVDRLKLFTSKGVEVDSSKYASTYITNGMTLSLYDANGNLIESATIIVSGDLNGDGKINQRDKSAGSKIAVDNSIGTAVQLYALELNFDGKQNSNDVDIIISYMDGGDSINDEYLIS